MRLLGLFAGKCFVCGQTMSGLGAWCGRIEPIWCLARMGGSSRAARSKKTGFKKQVTPAGIRHVIEGALELSPCPRRRRSAGNVVRLRPGTPDDLPIIGLTGVEGLLIATGHYRNGILLAPVTARLMRNFLMRQHNDFDSQAFSPMRFASQARAAT